MSQASDSRTSALVGINKYVWGKKETARERFQIQVLISLSSHKNALCLLLLNSYLRTENNLMSDEQMNCRFATKKTG